MNNILVSKLIILLIETTIYTFPVGEVTDAFKSEDLIPGILNVNRHWLPTSVTGTASLILSIFSVCLIIP